MKYHITPKQAKEIAEEQFYSMFNEIVPRKDWANYHHRKMDIGKMIDYLDGVKIYKGFGEKWHVSCYGVEYINKELTDALWEAVRVSMK